MPYGCVVKYDMSVYVLIVCPTCLCPGQVSLQLEHSREEAVSLRAAVQQFEAKHSQVSLCRG